MREYALQSHFLQRVRMHLVGKSKPVDASSGQQRMASKKVKGSGTGKVELPTATESNAAADSKAQMLCTALMIVFGIMVLAGVGFSLAQLYQSIVVKADVLGIFFGAAGLIVSVLLGRALLWLTFLLPILYASKMNAWKAEEALSKKALGLRKVIPTAGSTAAVMLMQGYIKRGDFDQALAFGEEQFQQNENDKKYLQALAPVFSGVALACQTKANWKDSITWNERAITAFEGIQTEMTAKKGLLQRFAAQQDAQVSGSVKTQLALSTFSNANSYFNLRNFRTAKELYKKAIDLTMQAPDSPEKAEIMRVSKEQLTRLKHQ